MPIIDKPITSAAVACNIAWGSKRMPHRKKGGRPTKTPAATPAQQYLLSLRDDLYLENLKRVSLASASSVERSALDQLYANRVGNIADLDNLVRKVFRLLVCYFRGLSTRPPTLHMVRNSAFRIGRLIAATRDYRGSRTPKEEIKLFTDRCRLADRECDALIAAVAERELSYYAQDFLQQFSGQRAFPNFWYQLRDGRLYVGSDQLMYAVKIAEEALNSTALNCKPIMPMHDELVRVIQYELSCSTGIKAKGAGKSEIKIGRFESVQSRRTGTVHKLIKELGALGDLKLVNDNSDNRMRNRERPAANLSIRRRPSMRWMAR